MHNTWDSEYIEYGQKMTKGTNYWLAMGEGRS